MSDSLPRRKTYGTLGPFAECRRCGAAFRSPKTFYCDCDQCYDHREHLKQCHECGDQQHYPGPRPSDSLPIEGDS